MAVWRRPEPVVAEGALRVHAFDTSREDIDFMKSFQSDDEADTAERGPARESLLVTLAERLMGAVEGVNEGMAWLFRSWPWLLVRLDPEERCKREGGC